MMSKGVSDQGGGRVDQIFTLKQKGEKSESLCGFYGFGEGI